MCALKPQEFENGFMALLSSTRFICHIAVESLRLEGVLKGPCLVQHLLRARSMARSGQVAQSFILLGLETKGGHWAASLGNILQCLINLVLIFSPLIPSENLLCFNSCL